MVSNGTWLFGNHKQYLGKIIIRIKWDYVPYLPWLLINVNFTYYHQIIEQTFH